MDGGAAATATRPQATSTTGSQRASRTAGMRLLASTMPLLRAPSAAPATTSLQEWAPTITRDTATAPASR